MDKIFPVIINSGSPQLNDLLQSFRPGDNVVWQIDCFEDSPGIFTRILPDFSNFASVVRVIEIPSGMQAVVDPKTRNAICFLQ